MKKSKTIALSLVAVALVLFGVAMSLLLPPTRISEVRADSPPPEEFSFGISEVILGSIPNISNASEIQVPLSSQSFWLSLNTTNWANTLSITVTETEIKYTIKYGTPVVFDHSSNMSDFMFSLTRDTVKVKNIVKNETVFSLPNEVYTFDNNALMSGAYTCKYYVIYGDTSTDIGGGGTVDESPMSEISIAAAFGTTPVYAMIADNTNVYLSGNNNCFAKYNKATGVVTAIPNTLVNIWALADDNNFVYLGTGRNGFATYNKTTGEIKVIRENGTSDIFSDDYRSISALINDGNFVYIGGYKGSFERYNKTTGVITQITITGYNSTINALAQDSNYVYVGGGGYTDNFFRYNKTSGAVEKITTNYNVLMDIYAMTVDNDYVYFAGSYGKFAKYHKATGTAVNIAVDSIFDTGMSYQIRSLANDNDFVYIGGMESKIARYEKATSSLGEIENTAVTTIREIVISDGIIYYGGFHNGSFVKFNPLGIDYGTTPQEDLTITFANNFNSQTVVKTFPAYSTINLGEITFSTIQFPQSISSWKYQPSHFPIPKTAAPNEYVALENENWIFTAQVGTADYQVKFYVNGELYQTANVKHGENIPDWVQSNPYYSIGGMVSFGFDNDYWLIGWADNSNLIGTIYSDMQAIKVTSNMNFYAVLDERMSVVYVSYFTVERIYYTKQKTFLWVIPIGTEYTYADFIVYRTESILVWNSRINDDLDPATLIGNGIYGTPKHKVLNGYEFTGWKQTTKDGSRHYIAEYETPKIDVRYYSANGVLVETRKIDPILVPIVEVDTDVLDGFIKYFQDIVIKWDFVEFIDDADARGRAREYINYLSGQYEFGSYEILFMTAQPDINIDAAFGLFKSSAAAVTSSTFRYLMGRSSTNDYVYYADLSALYVTGIKYDLRVTYDSGIDKTINFIGDVFNNIGDWFSNIFGGGNLWWIILIVLCVFCFPLVWLVFKLILSIIMLPFKWLAKKIGG